MDFEFLRPKFRLRVMDLVEETGIDISDWASSKGGKEQAASNPKYCYEWSFEDPEKKLITVNLWHENLSEEDGNIVQKLNLRETARNAASTPQSKRANKMDFSLQKAARLKLPVRVIICDGGKKDLHAKSWSAERRLLDDEPWYVKSYDSISGEYILIRGKKVVPFIDQFGIDDTQENQPTKRKSTTSVYVRSHQVRSYVLNRAAGFCEWCGNEGFITQSGSIYLETHHIQPLSEGGSDAINNVIALCPNHHREAHFGQRSTQLRDLLAQHLENINQQIKPATE